MREILFRGKRKDDGEWIEGLPSYDMNGNLEEMEVYRGFCNCNIYEVDSSTVCQYTGLTDKNGRKIFEGDIVRCGGNLVVMWDEKFAGWCLTREGWLYKHFFGEACEPKDCEVIGNIFDNPDLIANHP